MIADGMNEYDRRSEVLPIEVSNAGSTVRHLCTRVSCVGILDVARPVLKETKIILATRIIRPLPQWVLVLLQRVKHNPRSYGLARRMVARGEKECEGRRRYISKKAK
ncbi:hypothetical protein K443DRAFT_10475 [Laccaria amethystina LaAM-08-1]|uniref:Uncharacterized protein n=1 Tax=Laccaria amethystina LaAM-08-1 TaxID=1095629 RepID=A0A0C9X5T9_9AGAR|nr:hypothetical protein K443DRAFT_10475 [Laccaria amethystina LaAM-08-1]